MSIDRREDAGDFYPGGKVISTRPVATGGDVKHSDFAGLDVKTNTIPDLREAVRELGRRLGATIVTALAACVAVAATVQTVPVNDLDFDANPSIVTNVVFDAPPDFSTNNTELVETIEATAPAPGDYAVVSNAAVHATITNALQDAALAGKADDADVALNERGFSEWVCKPATDESGFRYSVYWDTTYQAWMLRINDGGAAHWGPEDINATSFTVDVKGQTVTATRTAFPGYRLGPDSESNPNRDKLLASEAEAEALRKSVDELRQNNSQTRQIVTTWENFLDGSNVVFSITNYLSGSYNLDAAKLRILELRDGEYHEVFNSRDEILLHIENFRTNDFRVATNQLVGAVNEAIDGKADRDWGKYTSAGGEAPENTVYMTAPNTVFAGGLEYERVAVGEGTICVLTTRGAPVWTQGDEGTFKFQDDGGTNFFGFAKTDSYTIGANTDGITVQSGIVTLTYNITMSGRPCVWYKSSLSSGAWEQLNLPDGSPVAGASHAVTWEQNPDPGTQVCYINVGNAPSGFFRASVEVTGDAKFTTNMKADLSGGIICPNTATGVNGVIKPSFNGSSVIWTWSAK